MNITRNSRFVLLALYLYAAVSAQKCTVKEAIPVREIFKRCYDATYDHIRRGFPDEIASYHLRMALFDIMFYAEVSGSHASPLSEVCVPQKIYGKTFSVRWTTVLTEQSLDDMLLSISNVLYNTKDSASPLPTPKPDQLKEKVEHWVRIENELRKTPDKVDSWDFRFPQTVKHFYDMKYEEACTEWQKHAGTSTTIADTGLRNILKMVINLISVGCDEDKSWQLLRHYTALVHLGIRCDKKERAELQVPDTFTGTYNAAGLRIMEDARKLGNLREFNDLHNYAFDIIYTFIIDRLTTFGSWGIADVVFDTSIVVKNVMGFTSHSVNTKIEKLDYVVRTYGNKTYANNLPDTVRNYGSSVPDCKTMKNEYGIMKCNTKDYFCYFNPNNEPIKNSFYEQCCNKLVCTNAVTAIASGTSFHECCKQQNQNSKPLKLTKNEDLKVPLNDGVGYKTIHVYLL